MSPSEPPEGYGAAIVETVALVVALLFTVAMMHRVLTGELIWPVG